MQKGNWKSLIGTNLARFLHSGIKSDERMNRRLYRLYRGQYHYLLQMVQMKYVLFWQNVSEFSNIKTQFAWLINYYLAFYVLAFADLYNNVIAIKCMCSYNNIILILLPAQGDHYHNHDERYSSGDTNYYPFILQLVNLGFTRWWTDSVFFEVRLNVVHFFFNRRRQCRHRFLKSVY